MSLQRLIVDMVRALRELAGGAFQQLPSSEASFESAPTRGDVERYLRGATARWWTAASASTEVRVTRQARRA